MTFPGSDTTRPIVAQLTLERPRLLQKLELAAKHRLTLIAAPPGYGKTTLSAHFANQTDLPVVWHTVEKREHDAPMLFEHSLSALSSVIPDLRTLEWPAGAALEERVVLMGKFLQTALTRNILYFLDDVQNITDSPSAEAWLQTFIANVPPTCHVILIGRSLPHIAIAEMVAHREVLAIGQQELGFTFQEVEHLAQKLDLSLDTSQIEKLLARFMGWPAGILLALQPLPDEIEASLFNFAQGPEALFDELAELTLRHQPPLLQDFLLRSSTLSRMTPALCQSVLGVSSSVDYLTQAIEHNLFLTQISGGMVYHSLFRDFLQRQLQTRDLALFLQLHADAGRWFEAANELDEAFDHYMAAQQWDQAAAIPERAVHTYFAQGQWETILDWKTQLSAIGVSTPRLAYFCAMLDRDRNDYLAADAHAAEAEAGYHDRSNEVGLIQVALLKATIDNQRGDYAQAIASSEPFINQMSVPANLRGFALAIVGIAHIQLGNAAAAISHLETALPLWRDTGDAFALAHLLVNLGTAYLHGGQFDKATLAIQEALEIRRAIGGSVGIAVTLNSLGNHFRLLGEYQQALVTLEEGLKVARRVPGSREEGYLLSSLGDLRRDCGAFDEAAIFYHQALQVTSRPEPYVQSSVLLGLSTLYRWQGKPEEARTLALKASVLADRHHLVVERVIADVALLALRLEEHDPPSVLPLLENLVSIWLTHPSMQFVQLYGMCAHAALLNADTGGAHDYLQRAITTSLHPANLQPLIAEIYHTSLLREYVSGHAGLYPPLIEGIGKLENAQVAPVFRISVGRIEARPTYSLRISILGQERIERDGVAVPLNAWQAASARSLFYYLLLRGPATREQIGLVFGPNYSAQQLRQNFHAALHRLRDAVGANVVLFQDELYSLNPDLDLWCDAFDFEATVQQAKLASPLLAHTEVIWRHAVDLYRGDLLIAFDEDWIVGYRETLHQLYLDALLALGNTVRRRDSLHEAILLYKQALDVDPYREDIHRALLRAYAASGERSLVVRHRDKLIALFKDELGIPPSHETTTLVQTLLA